MTMIMIIIIVIKTIPEIYCNILQILHRNIDDPLPE